MQGHVRDAAALASSFEPVLACTCIGSQKCRIDIVETRITLILLVVHPRRNSSCLHLKIFAKSIAKI